VKESRKNDWPSAVAAAFSNATRIIVCGIGNELRGDDGAGILCLRHLIATHAQPVSSKKKSRKSVFFLEGGEAPENQTGRMRDFRPDLVVLIDAARGGGSAGDIFVVDPDRIADDEVSTHRISLGMLVRFIRESIGSAVLFLGIEPQSTEMGQGVSEAVKEAIFELSEYLDKAL